MGIDPPSSNTGTRPGWLAMSSDEDSRSYLQSRLALLSRILFLGFLIILGAQLVVFREAPGLEPARNNAIVGIGGGGIVVLATLRLVLHRRRLTMRQLFGIDAILAGGCGIVLASAAYLGSELKSSANANLLWVCFVIFTRATLIPSTGARTAAFGALTYVPMFLAAIGIALKTEQELPPTLFIGSTFFIGIMVITLAAIGSRTIYGLRRQVRRAMQLGQYTLDRKIGEGGMGAVYLAHHALLRRPTAIKLLLPDRIDGDSLDRFEREVQHMSRLTHANTVAVFDYGRSADGVFYYAMEYLGGGIDLEKLVVNYGPQPAGRVIHILRQVCRALQEAHDNGVIHRDVKPANIILCERGGEPDVAKVVDYGLAKEVKGDGDATTRVVLGTPAYIAPEAITDPGRVGPAADLYALGAVGYFLLTGKRVFEGKTAMDVCVQHVTASPRPPSQVTSLQIPVDLEEVLMRCLVKQPGERPGPARALGEKLTVLSSGSEWSDADAREWWRSHRSEIAASDNEAKPTMTLAIDLSERPPRAGETESST